MTSIQSKLVFLEEWRAETLERFLFLARRYAEEGYGKEDVLQKLEFLKILEGKIRDERNR